MVKFYGSYKGKFQEYFSKLKYISKVTYSVLDLTIRFTDKFEK